ncbi:hypothetical protein [Zhongshania sp.]|jgi:hypothetical protein|uniref:hypothetical protein n=1 Tax=Zhongshania sp. TaxID=1971902 RepID=UPI0039E464B5
MNAENLAIISAGVFFLAGLLTGVWKYQQIMKSEDSSAHPYVDICHRASLLYAFAAILLAKFAEVSQLSNRVELIAVGVVVFYFATAITTYLVHGLLKDTDNQLKSPHAMGQLTISSRMISLYMWTLIAAEIGGFLVLFYGVLIAIF